MNRSLLKIEAFVMALLVMFSTLSFSVEKHFCGNMLMDTAFFSNAENCKSEAKICGEDMDSEMTPGKDSCCTNHEITIEGQDELPQVSFYCLDFDQQVFLKTFVYNFIYLNEDLSLKEIPFKYYSPPLLVSDIHVLDQVFLI